MFHSLYQQVRKLTLQSLPLGPETSKQCARGVFTMTNLKSLEVINGKLDKLFFSTLLELASTTQVGTLDFGIVPK